MQMKGAACRAGDAHGFRAVGHAQCRALRVQSSESGEALRHKYEGQRAAQPTQSTRCTWEGQRAEQLTHRGADQPTTHSVQSSQRTQPTHSKWVQSSQPTHSMQRSQRAARHAGPFVGVFQKSIFIRFINFWGYFPTKTESSPAFHSRSENCML